VIPITENRFFRIPEKTCNYSALLASRRRRTNMLMTSSAKVGARVTRARNSFFEIGTIATSVLAICGGAAGS